MTKLEHAQQFLSNGIAVIPLRHRGKEPESSMIKSWEPYRSELPTQAILSRWLASDWQNYGVVCGWRDLVVIDFDDAAAFDVWLNYFAILNKHEEVYPMPYIVKTARGAHVYVSMPGHTGGNEKRRGVDIKVHGYVVGPGSVHPSGAVYTPINEFRLVEVYSLESFLPSELFPSMGNGVCDASRGVYVSNLTQNLPVVNQRLQAEIDYDPWQAAMVTQDVDLITIVKQRVRIEHFQWRELHRTSADGRWLAALCPFHEDHKPSFWIDTARQLCGCATCGMRPMDVLNLYARIHNMSESQAVSALAQEVGVWA